jgi:CotH protein/chitobiase/beta-hexosaminidase-like protein/lamin tail-like protein
LLTLLMVAVSTSTWAVEVVVDNDDGAPGYTTTGSFRDSTSGATLGYDGGGYQYALHTDVFSRATWTPDIPETGAYEVKVVFLRGSNRVTAAPYKVTHADGSQVVHVDQTAPFAEDLATTSLGIFSFNQGTGGSIALTNDNGSGATIADTVIFTTATGPEVNPLRLSPLYPPVDQVFTVLVAVQSQSAIDEVQIGWSASPSGQSGSVFALDDGLHGDGEADDLLFGGELPGFPDGEEVTLTATARDVYGLEGQSVVKSVVIGASGTWSLKINEVLASNSETNVDPDFQESGDWVEIYNEGPDAADLAGMGLSDRADQPDKWLFPAGATLEPMTYLLVWCDNHDVVGQALHTSFKLSSDGESVVLYDPVADVIVDQVDFPALMADESFARLPNLSATWGKTIIPTPMAENQLGIRGDAPVLSHLSGMYSDPLSVTMTAAEALEIRYTLDGSEPTLTSILYDSALSVSATTNLRAKAWYDAADPSLVTSAFYFYDAVGNRQIPALFLQMDPDDLFDPNDGIYTNYNERGEAWERPVHVVAMAPDGSIVEETDCGVRIHGGYSRSADKKSFRLYFRSTYGENSWMLPWMERTEQEDGFSQLVLRAGGNDTLLVRTSSQLNEATYLRDQIMRDWYAEQGQFAADGFFAALYLNGEYWGLYNLTERITDDTMEEVEGGENWDIVKGTWTYATKFYTEATDGTLDEWNAFLAWLDNSALAGSPDFETLLTKIDIDNFLDFFAMNITCQNEDWPHNNWITSKRWDDPTSQWTWHEWDSEWGLGLRPQGWTSDTITWARGDNYHLSPSHNGEIAPLCLLFSGNELDPNRPKDIDGILDHPVGRQLFISAVEDFLNHEFDTEKALGDLNAYAALIESEIAREASRWSGSAIVSESQMNAIWPAAVEKMRQFITNRPAVMKTLMEDEFTLSGMQTVRFEATGTGYGKVKVNGHLVTLPWEGEYFHASPVKIKAMPSGTSVFTNWSGDFVSDERSTQYQAQDAGPATIYVNFEKLPGTVIFLTDAKSE